MLRPTILWDCTDLIDYASKRRPFTGIQRVTFEIGAALLDCTQVNVLFVYLDDAEDRAKFLTPAGFLSIGGLQERRQVPLAKLWGRFIRAFAGQGYAFPSALRSHFAPEVPAEYWLVSADASWKTRGLQRLMRALERATGARPHLGVVIHDLMPLEFPELVASEKSSRFEEWFDFVIGNASVMYSVSDATSRAIERFAPRQKAPVMRLRLGSSRLECDEGYEIESGEGYFVYVSSVNPRKNHPTVLKAWVKAFADDTARAPDLVFVGHCKRRKEWELRELVTAPGLRAKFRILRDLPDRRMAAVVQRSTLFLYPSLAEGWGLPVEEAMDLGKFGIVSNSSSLPEVGRDLVCYCDPRNVDEWAAAMRRYWFDKAALHAAEARIQGLQAPSWKTSAMGIVDHIAPREHEKSRIVAAAQ